MCEEGGITETLHKRMWGSKEVKRKFSRSKRRILRRNSQLSARTRKGKRGNKMIVY